MRYYVYIGCVYIYQYNLNLWLIQILHLQIFFKLNFITILISIIFLLYSALIFWYDDKICYDILIFNSCLFIEQKECEEPITVVSNIAMHASKCIRMILCFIMLWERRQNIARDCTPSKETAVGSPVILWVCEPSHSYHSQET